MFFERPVQIVAQYESNNEINIENVIISEFEKNEKNQINVLFSDFTYEEDKDRYVLDGATNGRLVIAVSSMDYLEFTLTYRLNNSEILPENGCILVSEYADGELISKQSFKLAELYRTKGRYIYDGNFVLKCLCHGILFSLYSICLMLFYKIVIKWRADIFEKVWKFIGHSYFNVGLFAIAWEIKLGQIMLPYYFGGDTSDYLLDSLGDLSWGYRMPVYRILLYIIKSISGVVEWTEAFPYIVFVQRAISVIAALALHDAIRKVCKSKKMAFLFSIMSAIAIGTFGNNEIIMTESIAVSLMCLVIWSIVCLIYSLRRRYIVFCCLFTMAGILTRPSFLFMIPILLIFFVIFGLIEKNGFLKCGLGCMVICILVLGVCCKQTERIRGYFTLCTVIYHNELSVLLGDGMYNNAEYPEISEAAQEKLESGKEKLRVAIELCNEFGYKEIAAYSKSCRKIYRGQYIRRIERLIHYFWDKPIVCIPVSGAEAADFEIIRMLVIPYNLGMLLLLVIAELSYALYQLIFKHQLCYLSFGVPGCILAILLTTFFSLENLSMERFIVHAVPLTLLLVAMMCDRGIRYFNDSV